MTPFKLKLRKKNDLRSPDPQVWTIVLTSFSDWIIINFDQIIISEDIKDET